MQRCRWRHENQETVTKFTSTARIGKELTSYITGLLIEQARKGEEIIKRDITERL
jgi:hypothetical protein